MFSSLWYLSENLEVDMIAKDEKMALAESLLGNRELPCGDVRRLKQSDEMDQNMLDRIATKKVPYAHTEG